LAWITGRLLTGCVVSNWQHLRSMVFAIGERGNP
jgi:uncharacterized MAPEG superfamily protein